MLRRRETQQMLSLLFSLSPSLTFPVRWRYSVTFKLKPKKANALLACAVSMCVYISNEL